MSWLEVEVKVKITDEKDLRCRIKKIATFVKKETKGDDYFALKRKGYPKKAFRIRSIHGEYTVNFKKWLKKYWSKDIVVKDEFEFNIKNPKHFLALMYDLGFVEWVKKIKTSETYRYNKDKRVGIEINNVKHLGYFMEIEYLCKKNEIGKAKKQIRKVLKELCIDPRYIDNTGYTKMLWDKGIKDKKYFLT